MGWTNLIEPPRRAEGAGAVGGALAPPPGASGTSQEFPDIPEKIGGGIGDREQMPSEEYMDVANNVALSKYYAHEFMENWPLYLGGTAVVLYLVFRR
jgi:hypothetical protein